MGFVSECRLDKVNYLSSALGEKNLTLPISCKASSLTIYNQITSESLSLGFFLGCARSFLKESVAVVNVSIWVCSTMPSITETHSNWHFYCVYKVNSERNCIHANNEYDNKLIIECFLQRTIWAILWPFFSMNGD